jgi:hypothetical protein
MRRAGSRPALIVLIFRSAERDDNLAADFFDRPPFYSPASLCQQSVARMKRQWAGRPSGEDLGFVPQISAFESPPAHQHFCVERLGTR